MQPWAAVWGGRFSPALGWVFPAYPPLGLRSFEDLRRVAAVDLDAEAWGYVQACRQAKEGVEDALGRYQRGDAVDLAVPDGFDFPVPPFAHQRYGLARVLADWRAWLLWEMGTGKTAVIINLLRALKARGEHWRALVICPRVVVSTWSDEAAFHSAGQLRVVDLTRGDRQRRIAEANEADLAVVTYGIVRTEMRAACNDLLPEGFQLKGDYSDAAIRRTLKKLLVADRRLHDETVGRLKTVPMISGLYQQLDYNLIVADESHVLGDPNSETTKAVLQLSAKAARRYELTGTAADKPLQLYGQLQFLHPALEKRSYWAFRQDHVQYDPLNKHLVIGYKDMRVLNAKVEIVASRMKKADCLDLPLLTITDLRIQMGARQRRRYNELVEEMRATAPRLVERVQQGFTSTIEEVPGMHGVIFQEETYPAGMDAREVLMELAHGAECVNKLLQVASGFLIVNPPRNECDGCEHLTACLEDEVRPHTRRCQKYPAPLVRKVLRDFENPKLEAFEELAGSIREQDPDAKVITWATYLPELDDLEELCCRKKWGYVRVDGSNTGRIAEHKARFRDDPAVWLYLGQSASGIGVNLTAANFTIFYSLPWNRIVYRQAFDRNYRAGQTRPVTAYRLLAAESLDEFVVHALQCKDDIAYTLTERVVCAACSQHLVCGEAGIRPFRRGCRYASDVIRPVAKPRTVKEQP
jgi:SNF2 family DNA or RNA helicase